MTDQTKIAEADLRNKVIELARNLGTDATSITLDDTIPETGFLDSGAIFELLAWYEDHFRIRLAPSEITVKNLGSIRLMAAFALQKQAK